MQIVLCHIDQGDVHQEATTQQHRVVEMATVIEGELYHVANRAQSHQETHHGARFTAGSLHNAHTSLDRALDPFAAYAINNDIIFTQCQLEADPVLAVTFETRNIGRRKRRGVGPRVQARTQIGAELWKVNALRELHDLFGGEDIAKFGFTLRRHHNQLVATLFKTLKITAYMAQRQAGITQLGK